MTDTATFPPPDPVGPMATARAFMVERRTVDRWADNGTLGPVYRTPGNHRVFSIAAIEQRHPGFRARLDVLSPGITAGGRR